MAGRSKRKRPSRDDLSDTDSDTSSFEPFRMPRKKTKMRKPTKARPAKKMQVATERGFVFNSPEVREENVEEESDQYEIFVTPPRVSKTPIEKERKTRKKWVPKPKCRVRTPIPSSSEDEPCSPVRFKYIDIAETERRNRTNYHRFIYTEYRKTKEEDYERAKKYVLSVLKTVAQPKVDTTSFADAMSIEEPSLLEATKTDASKEMAIQRDSEESLTLDSDELEFIDTIDRSRTRADLCPETTAVCFAKGLCYGVQTSTPENSPDSPVKRSRRGDGSFTTATTHFAKRVSRGVETSTPDERRPDLPAARKQITVPNPRRRSWQLPFLPESKRLLAKVSAGRLSTVTEKSTQDITSRTLDAIPEERESLSFGITSDQQTKPSTSTKASTSSGELRIVPDRHFEWNLGFP